MASKFDLKQLQDERGFLEGFHKILGENDPDFLSKYNEVWRHNMRRPNGLPAKMVDLLRLACVATAREPVGVRHTIENALKDGATKTEILQTIQIAYHFSGAPTLVIAMPVWKEVIDEWEKSH